MTDRYFIRCRAQLEGVGCYHGQPTRLQFGEDDPLDCDGTWDPQDGGTIVCDPCYIALMPLTSSGRGLSAELPGAIERYRRRASETS